VTDETYEKLLDLVKAISISQEVFDEDAPQKRARKDHPPVVSGVQTVAKAARDKKAKLEAETASVPQTPLPPISEFSFKETRVQEEEGEVTPSEPGIEISLILPFSTITIR